jgi:hypothetical protein
MNTETLQIIENRFKVLPPNILKVVTNYPWAEKIIEINKNHNLTNEQGNQLAIEICILVLAMESPRKVSESILKNIELSPDQADGVLEDIERLIIKPILEQVSLGSGNSEKVTAPEITEPELQTQPNEVEENSKPKLTSIPNYSDYDSGKDPYREPLE